MMQISDLPMVNASLNFLALILLLLGRWMIRQKDIKTHRAFMIAAFCVSIVFLASYLTYRFAGKEKHFTGQGWVRPLYFFILITHVALAATVPVLASRTLYLGLCQRWDQHKRWAKITFPIWVYVSVTGVLVYLMLFVLYGPTVQQHTLPVGLFGSQ